MQTKAIFLVLVLSVITCSAGAQLAGNKFQAKLGEMGIFNLEFKQNTFVLSNANGVALINGEYRVEENTLTLIDKEGPMACQPGNKGVYRYALKNNELKMEPVEENCPGRKAMASTPWKLIED